MSRRYRDRNGGGVFAFFVVLGVCCGLPTTFLLAAPAMAARIVVSGAPALQHNLRGWAWTSLASPLLALLLVRLVLGRDGRLRGGSSVGKVLLGLLKRAGLLLGAVNVAMFVQLMRAGSTQHDIEHTSTVAVPAVVGVAVLIGIALWDLRPEPVTVEEVRAVTAEADRALRRVRAENERVRRQAEQVRARLEKLRAPQARTDQPGRSEVDFHSLRTFHRDSYQCADTAHMAYRSSQDSLHTMTSIVRRMRYAPQSWVTVGRAAKLAKAEMRAAVGHLAQSRGELRTQVDRGLGMVRELNANTAELKHEIRDSCGERGRQWYAALEERIEEARASRG